MDHLPGHNARGKPSWNRGRTKKTDARVCSYSSATARGVKKKWARGDYADKVANTDYDAVGQAESKTKARLISEGKLQTSRYPYKRGTYKGEHYDSSYELNRMKELESMGIVFTKKHGIRIRYKVDGKWHYYIPDFLVGNVVEEIKSTWTMKKDLKKNRAKFRAATKWCREHGMKFRLKVVGE
jgi:hypothetical protein